MSVDKVDGQLSVVVVEEDLEEDRAPGELEKHEPRQFIGRRRSVKRNVKLADVESQLEDVQGQVQSLLSKIKEAENAKYQLSEIEFGLSLTAEGSIGVATVGAEISITLTYSRRS